MEGIFWIDDTVEKHIRIFFLAYVIESELAWRVGTGQKEFVIEEI